ncbi:MAG: hypothetical protein ACFB0G_11065 [Leptolyngbyaceae cyanobacterium]
MPTETLVKPTGAPVAAPDVGSKFLVTHPAIARERLRGESVEFLGVDAETHRWECKCGKMRVLFAQDELQPLPELREHQWVRVQPRVQTHRKLWGEDYPVTRSTPEHVYVLGDDDKELELAWFEIQVCEPTGAPVGKDDRTERRLRLENRVKQAFSEMMEALGEILREELWRDALDATGAPYESPRHYVSAILAVRKNQANDYIAAANLWDSLAEVPVEQRPQSLNATAALKQVEPEQRPEVLAEIAEQGKAPTKQVIKQAIAPDRPPISIGDHIAPDTEPTALLGRVTGIADDGQVEYTRFGKTQAIASTDIVHQASVTGPIHENPISPPENVAEQAQPGKNIQTIEEPSEAVTGDSRPRFNHGDLVQWNARFWVVGKVNRYSDRSDGLQLLSYNAETLNNWVAADEVAIATECDPLGLTIEIACESMVREVVKAFGVKSVLNAVAVVEPDELQAVLTEAL